MQSIVVNQTIKAGANSPTNGKVDCAKECPCGVPVIPVPDQWLEVMVNGGFKVWHIIFIIIAFIVTMIVVYCCFHRCRIPRTKQEIEADLMRMNLANKFRDYLQELPNEQTTFMEALKKVQELEDKLEKDDALYSRELGARKRMGWLKLKGKGPNQPDKEPLTGGAQDAPNAEAAKSDIPPVVGSNGLALTSGDAKNKTAKAEAQVPATGTAKTSQEPVSGTAKLPAKKGTPATVPEPIMASLAPPQPEARPPTAKPPPLPPAGSSAAAAVATAEGLLPTNDDTGEGLKVGASAGGQTRQLRRPRRHKPNLSRTKAAREKLHNGDSDGIVNGGGGGGGGERPAPVPVVATATVAAGATAAEKDKSAEPVVANSRRHSGRHGHRIKKEPKITVPSETG